MALTALPGGWDIPFCPGRNATRAGFPAAASGGTLDAANEATSYIGRVVTADGGSHTIDTTGSSSIGWRSTLATFANAGTTVKVGIGTVDTGAGPAGRATAAANVITFDVAAVFTGGGGGITSAAWQTSVPTTGTKTIANGDLVAVSIQMTARAGADSVIAGCATFDSVMHRPVVSSYTGGVYAAVSAVPNVIITFSDGTLGWIHGGDVFNTISTRTWNSGSATKEYGQLYQLPFPVKVYGLYGWIDPDADCDVVLYSDPLGGSPVAEKTCSIDANTTATATPRTFMELFASPYTTTANQPLGAVFKPGGSNVSAAYKTFASATHRVTDPYGTDGYGISRASGAFADANSGLDNYYIGLLVGAFDAGGGGGRAIQVNNPSLVS